ncbi:MAG: hypothetical protein AB1756_10715 [Acidobacteriota bacterium]
MDRRNRKCQRIIVELISLIIAPGSVLLFSVLEDLAAKVEEPIPASIRILVQYGEEKNRESYRTDISNLLENYLLKAECFLRVVTESREHADLVLEATILELKVLRDYGASLGEIVSEQGDPDARTRLVITYTLRLDVLIRRSDNKDKQFHTQIAIAESNKKMYPGEDTEKYAWEAILTQLEHEMHKRICKQKGKIIKALLH